MLCKSRDRKAEGVIAVPHSPRLFLSSGNQPRSRTTRRKATVVDTLRDDRCEEKAETVPGMSAGTGTPCTFPRRRMFVDRYGRKTWAEVRNMKLAAQGRSIKPVVGARSIAEYEASSMVPVV